MLVLPTVLNYDPSHYFLSVSVLIGHSCIKQVILHELCSVTLQIFGF
jgi:hypothetical protein